MAYHGLEVNKNVHSRSSKTALNKIFLAVYLIHWKTSDLHLVPEDFSKKWTILENCFHKKYSEINLIILCGVIKYEKKIISASVNTLPIKLLPLLATILLTLRSI